MNKGLIVNTLGKMLLVICSAIMIGFALLLLVYCIPTKQINKNITASYHIFEKEGEEPYLIGEHKNTRLDNYTDAIMLLNAGYNREKSILKTALLVPRNFVVDCEMASSLVQIYRQDEGIEITKANYSRYWHGYLVILKPLLLFFNYEQLRYIVGFWQMALIFGATYLLSRRGKALYIIPLVVTYYYLYPPALSLSLQYNTIYTITLLQIIIMLWKEELYRNYRNWIWHFLIVGCLTSYMDFLTYPLVAFAIPFAYLLAVYGKGIRSDIRSFVNCGVSWCMGYAGMWMGKWVLATLFSGENAISIAKSSIEKRVGGQCEDYTHVQLIIQAIKSNLFVIKWLVPVVVCCLIIVLLFSIYKKGVIGNVVYLPIMFLPIAWYVVTANHSYIHAWMTFRTMAITLFTALLWITDIVKKTCLKDENDATEK